MFLLELCHLPPIPSSCSYRQELIPAGKYVAVDLLDPQSDWRRLHREIVPLPEDQAAGEIVVDFSLIDQPPEREGYVLHAFIAPYGADFTKSTTDADQEVEVWRVPQRLSNGDFDAPVASSNPKDIPFWSSQESDAYMLDATSFHTAPQSFLQSRLGKTIWQSMEVLPNRELELSGRLFRPSSQGGDVFSQRGVIALQFYDHAHKYMSEERAFITSEHALLMHMLDDPQEDVVFAAAVALGHRGDSRAIPQLVRLVEHPSSLIRLGAVHGLSGHEEDLAICTMIRLTHDPDHDVRNWAVFGIGSQIEKDSPEIRDVLRRNLSDPDHEIRGEAIVGLAERRDGGVSDVLIQEWESSETISVLSLQAAAITADPRLLQYLNQFKSELSVEDDSYFKSVLEDAITTCKGKAEPEPAYADKPRGTG